MIKTPVTFNEDSLVLTFSSRRYLLEAAIESELPDAEFSSLVNMIRLRALSGRQVKMTKAVKFYVPTEVINFIGMKKYTAEWWACLLKMERVAEKETYLVVVGWKNFNGVDAVVVYEGDKKSATTNFEGRFKDKAEAGYSEIFTVQNLQVGSLMPTLPVIKGLPPIEEPAMEPEPEILPEPVKPKPKKAGSVASTPVIEIEKEEEVQAKPRMTRQKTQVAKKETLKELMARRRKESDW